MSQVSLHLRIVVTNLTALAVVLGWHWLTRPTKPAEVPMPPAQADARLAAEVPMPQVPVDTRLARVIPELKLHDVKLDEAIKAVGKAAGVELTITYGISAGGTDYRIWADFSNITARSAIEEIAHGARMDMSCHFHDATVNLGLGDDVGSPVTRTYSVQDLLQQAELFSNTVNGSPNGPVRKGLPRHYWLLAMVMAQAPDSWVDYDGTIGGIEFQAGSIVVTHTPAVHSRIARLLQMLRTREARLESLWRVDTPEAGARLLGPAAGLHRILPEAKFDHAGLPEVIGWVHERTGVNLTIHETCFRPEGSEQGHTVTMHLRNVPAWKVLDQAIGLSANQRSELRIAYYPGGHTAHLVPRFAMCDPTEWRVYDVSDLICDASRFMLSFDTALRGSPASRSQWLTGPSPDTFGEPSSGDLEQVIIHHLMDCVSGIINPESWRENGGRIGRHFYWAGRLLIAQTPEAHARIEPLLQTLRSQPTRGVSSCSGK